VSLAIHACEPTFYHVSVNPTEQYVGLFRLLGDFKLGSVAPYLRSFLTPLYPDDSNWRRGDRSWAVEAGKGWGKRKTYCFPSSSIKRARRRPDDSIPFISPNFHAPFTCSTLRRIFDERRGRRSSSFAAAKAESDWLVSVRRRPRSITLQFPAQGFLIENT
jgi:hypothetical protein